MAITTADAGMPLTGNELAQQKAQFSSHTAYYASLGYDRLAAVSFVLDEAGQLDGPVLEVVIGTHPIPQKYYLTHTELGTWDGAMWAPLLEPTLADEPTRLAYD
jgi:hypothetical protein